MEGRPRGAMMRPMVAYLPLVLAVFGALMYEFATPPKLAELGRLLFFAGIFACMLTFAGHAVRLMP